MILPDSSHPQAQTRRRTLAAFFLIILSALVALVPARLAGAQTFDATTLRQPTDMGMKWLVHAGDDPAYADKNFDDSQWTVVDPSTSLKTYFPGGRPGVVWYRLHIKVAPNQTGLALGEWNLASAFEIYANGEEILATGHVSPFEPSTFNARLLHRIPDDAIATGEVVIAVRIYISSTEWVSAFPGLYPYNLTIGQEKALSDQVWLSVIGENGLRWLYDFGGLGLGIIALALFTAQPQQREYLWIFLLFVSIALTVPLRFYELFHNVPAWWAYVSACLQIAGLVFQVLMYLAFLRMKPARWLQVFLALSAAGLLWNQVQTSTGAGSPAALLLSLVPELILIAGVIPVLLIVHWRRGNREAGILLVPAVVSSLAIYAQVGIFLGSLIPALAASSIAFSNAVFNWEVGPFTVNVGNLDDCLFVLSLGIILVLRSTRIAHQQAQIETELAAAREVQQIILPEQLESVPGFSVEAGYEPAQQVGGDFFQVLPAPEGSLLLVIGDVAGKGLPAAMLVSVLVGAIRGVAEFTSDPAELLASLNHRLVGRVAGNLSTAMAVRIFPDGAVELANAGHLAPYLDGKEVEVPGALPLGAKAGTRYETVRFLLPRGSRLTFYSDGIVEAQNEAGELFGFDRSRSISMQPVAKIIEAAKLHGQCDDITVISITRATAAEGKAWSGEAVLRVATP